MLIKSSICIIIFVMTLVPCLFGGENMDNQKEAVHITLETNLGKITLELYPKVAPKTVENFVGLVQKEYYNGVIFHRVIPNFMIQGGDPTGTGRGGRSIFGDRFEDEINPRSIGVPEADIKKNEADGYIYRDDLESMRVKYGKICMANAGPNTNGSQFFIVTRDDCPWLYGRHTAFGKVIKGMDIVEKIQNVKTDENNRPLEEIKIISALIME